MGLLDGRLFAAAAAIVLLGAAAPTVERIGVPVLFVHNRNDGCASSPPGGVAPRIARFPPGADVTRIDVTSNRLSGDPCEPLSPHGFLGIEGEVVAQIVAWMHGHGAKGTP